MRKWYLLIPALMVILLAVGCGAKAIPAAAITEIRALGQSEAVSNYAEIKQVDDRVGSAYIMLYIKSPSGEFPTREDALAQVNIFNPAFLRSVVDVLKSHGINGSVSVWIQLPLEEGGVTILGHSQYDGKKFYDFVPYTS